MTKIATKQETDGRESCIDQGQGGGPLLAVMKVERVHYWQL